ncbi:MAG TPA: hypothetical protein VJS64_10175 [Pyrinomonadaceae bacterium]|nr:hypothetical protein [Pyrinomonadaceae bacterium]
MTKLLEKVCCCLCFAIVSLASCSSNTLNAVAPANSNSVNGASERDEEKLFYLDHQKPEIVQQIAETDWVERPKFVQVDVVEVVNPKKHPISFQVYYRSPKESLYLGSFGLFPSDNPGKFIVATQGKVQKEGAIALALVVSTEARADDTIRVGVRRIKLGNGQ